MYVEDLPLNNLQLFTYHNAIPYHISRVFKELFIIISKHIIASNIWIGIIVFLASPAVPRISCSFYRFVCKMVGTWPYSCFLWWIVVSRIQQSFLSFLWVYRLLFSLCILSVSVRCIHIVACTQLPLGRKPV